MLETGKTSRLQGTAAASASANHTRIGDIAIPRVCRRKSYNHSDEGLDQRLRIRPQESS